MNDRQRDLEHLRLLSVFHYVVAALATLISMFPLIHLGIGIAMVGGAFDGDKAPPPPFVGWLLIAFAGSFILTGLTTALLIALAGRALARQRRYTFCCVMAGVACVFMPFGTALGVFTLIVLLRPGVRELFEPKPG